MEREKRSRLTWVVASLPLLLALGLIAWDSSASWRAERSRQAEEKRVRATLVEALDQLLRCADAAAPAALNRSLLDRLWAELVLAHNPQQKLARCIDQFDATTKPLFVTRKDRGRSRMRGTAKKLVELRQTSESLRKYASRRELGEACRRLAALQKLLLVNHSVAPIVRCNQKPAETSWLALPRPLWASALSTYVWGTVTDHSGSFISRVSLYDTRSRKTMRTSQELLMRTADGSSWEALDTRNSRRQRVDWGRRDAVALFGVEGGDERRWRFYRHDLAQPKPTELDSSRRSHSKPQRLASLRWYDDGGWKALELLPAGISPGMLRRSASQLIVLGYRKKGLAGIIRLRPDGTHPSNFDALQRVERRGVEHLIVTRSGNAVVLLSDLVGPNAFFRVYRQKPGQLASLTFHAKRTAPIPGLQICRRNDVVWVLHGRQEVYRGTATNGGWRLLHRFASSWGPVELACTERALMIVGARRTNGKRSFLHSSLCNEHDCPSPMLVTRRSVFGFGVRFGALERIEAIYHGVDDFGAHLRWNGIGWSATPIRLSSDRLAFELPLVRVNDLLFPIQRAVFGGR